MKVKITEETDKELKFELSSATTAFANLLRRYAMSRVPTFAIEEVMVYENKTGFFDEYVAHRLGLVPLTTPSKIKEGEEVTLMLEANEPGTVYTKDMKSTAKDVVPVSAKIPIVKLNPEQSLRLEAKAVLGKGYDHAKWQPGIVSYGYDEEGDYRFTVESYGQMTAKEIMKKALELIEENAAGIAEQLEKAAKE